MNDQAAKLRKMVEKRKDNIDNNYYGKTQNTQIVAIASGKGGVGKSNITINLGIALQRLGERVLVIDADMGMANIDILMGKTQKYNLGHILEDRCNFNDAIINGPEGLKVLPGTSGIEDFMKIGKKEVSGLLNVASHMELNYDIILLDIGAGIHQSVINFLISSDETIIVITPEPTSVMDAYSLIKVFSRYKTEKELGLLVNKVESKKEAAKIADRMFKVINQYLIQDISLLGYIPYDHLLKEAVKKQHPLITLYPESKSAQALTKLAQNLLNKKEKNPVKGAKGFMYRIIGLFNRD